MDRNRDAGGTESVYNDVALRKESVDRNNIEAYALYEDVKSLSARRAWIEIEQLLVHVLRTHGRSPQGERG